MYIGGSTLPPSSLCEKYVVCCMLSGATCMSHTRSSTMAVPYFNPPPIEQSLPPNCFSPSCDGTNVGKALVYSSASCCSAYACQVGCLPRMSLSRADQASLQQQQQWFQQRSQRQVRGGQQPSRPGIPAAAAVVQEWQMRACQIRGAQQ